MLPYAHQHQHQHLPLIDYDYDYSYAYDTALALPQSEQPTMIHPFTDTPQTLIPTPSDLLSSSSPYGGELDKPKPPRPDPLLPDAEPINKTETQRKARQRAVAEEIGFVPTDPYVSTIPSPFRWVIDILKGYDFVARKEAAPSRVLGTLRPVLARATQTRAHAPLGPRAAFQLQRSLFAQHAHAPRPHAERQQKSPPKHSGRGTSRTYPIHFSPGLAADAHG